MRATTDTPDQAHGRTDSDRHPFVVARAWPNERIWAAFEEWEPKHVADLVRGPGIVRGAYYHTVTSGIPEAYLGSGTIMAYYTARDLAGLFAFLQSAQFAAAVAEGEQWFGNFNPTDFEDITGNIYVVDSVVRPGVEPNAQDPQFTFWQRFEVPSRVAAEFDEWATAHASIVGSAEGIVRARTLSAVREGCPLPYYYSRGNRMVAADAESLDALLSPSVLAAVADSLQWDLSLEYVKRDVYRYRYHYDSNHGGDY